MTKMENRGTNKIFIIATLALSVLLVLMFRFQKQKEHEKTMYLVEYNRSLVELSQEKTMLQDELAQLEREFQYKYAGQGTITLLFKDLNSVLYEEIRPQLQSFNMAGVLMLSQEQFPGTGSCISMAQFQQMLLEGWEYCLEWNGSADEWSSEGEGNELERWLSQMQTLLAENNLEMPKTLYFQEGIYQNQYDAVLKEYGILTAVHHGENEEPRISVTFEKNAVWHLGAYPFHVQGGKTYVETCEEEKGSLAFTIGGGSQQEKYTKSSLNSLLEQLQERVEGETLKVTTAQKAYEYREQLEADAALDKDMPRKIEALEKQITDVELQMKELRAQYREDTGK